MKSLCVFMKVVWCKWMWSLWLISQILSNCYFKDFFLNKMIQTFTKKKDKKRRYHNPIIHFIMALPSYIPQLVFEGSFFLVMFSKQWHSYIFFLKNVSVLSCIFLVVSNKHLYAAIALFLLKQCIFRSSSYLFIYYKAWGFVNFVYINFLLYIIYIHFCHLQKSYLHLLVVSATIEEVF